jgi:hypothetical protein
VEAAAVHQVAECDRDDVVTSNDFVLVAGAYLAVYLASQLVKWLWRRRS